jgi:hypothetical protein
MILVVQPGSRIRMQTFSHPGSGIRYLLDQGCGSVIIFLRIRIRIQSLMLETNTDSGWVKIRIRHTACYLRHYPSRLPSFYAYFILLTLT